MSAGARHLVHHRRRRKAAEVYKSLKLSPGDEMESTEWQSKRKLLAFDGVQMLLSGTSGQALVSTLPPDVQKVSPNAPS